MIRGVHCFLGTERTKKQRALAGGLDTGTTFKLEDNLQDVWGEVSAGVNFFNPSANTSVFAKVDVTFGDDLDGVGGKAGMRVTW
jgi:autotransporter family porin